MEYIGYLLKSEKLLMSIFHIVVNSRIYYEIEAHTADEALGKELDDDNIIDQSLTRELVCQTCDDYIDGPMPYCGDCIEELPVCDTCGQKVVNDLCQCENNADEEEGR